MVDRGSSACQPMACKSDGICTVAYAAPTSAEGGEYAFAPGDPANRTIVRLARPYIPSEFNLFRQGQRIVELDSEITNRALQLAVSEQKLNCSQISGLAVNLRRLRSAH